MKKYGIVWVYVLGYLFGTQLKAQTDPFVPYLQHQAPKIVKTLVLKDTLGIALKEVVFALTDSTEVYVVIATPHSKGKHPGMLVLHGGGGAAEKDKAIAWAQRGYIAVAPDLPGIAEPKRLVHTKGRWNSLAYGAKRYVAKPDVRASVIFDAVASALQSLQLLRSQPQVDVRRIGVVGISWGGYMTTMLCGLAGKQIKAAFSVFGCGFYELTSQLGYLKQMPEAERKEWLQWLDAGARLPNCKAAYLVAAAANDFFFYPKAVQATLDHIKGDKNQVYAPNVSHQIPLPGGSIADSGKQVPFVATKFQPYPTPKGNNANWLQMEVPFMEYHLRKRGLPLPKVQIKSTDEPLTKVAIVHGKQPMQEAVVYWSSDCADVKACKWNVLLLQKIAHQQYRIVLPPEAKQWFCTVTNNQDISVSSALFSQNPLQ